MHTIRPRLLLVAAVAAATALPATASAKCTAGVHPYGGVQARTFCGPASASVSVGGKKAVLKGGQCDRTKDYFTINVGTTLLGTSSKRPDYFGITVGKTLGAGKAAGKDGTYTGAAVAIVTKNTTYAVTQSSVTLAGGRTKGTFSGTAIGGGKVSGSFACE